MHKIAGSRKAVGERRWAIQQSSSERVQGDNSEKQFFQSPVPTKPPPAPTTEEEEEELSLKGRPPPAPLFGDDSEEDDLDWLG